ncbi:MAG: regulatory protein GemA [Rubrivivax sp.]
MNALRQQPGRARQAPRRNGDLAQIHIAKKQLGLDDDTYRDMLWAVARVRSAKNLDHTGRAKVLEHLRRCGFTGAAAKRPKRPTPAPAVVAMVRKVRAQLIALGRLPDTYADGVAQRMFGVQFFEWLQPDQLHDLIAALQVHQVRTGAQTK